MKIKSDFVTNSSTTSYIIICDGDFTQQDLADLMGVQKGSAFSGLVESLYQSLHHGLNPARSAWQINKNYEGDFEAYLRGYFSEEVLRKVQDAERKGRNVFVGSLASDNNETESFFCCDSFEWENDKLYINALQCTWSFDTMATLRFQHYPDEHYLTLFNPETGFFVRAEEAGHDEPFWSEHGPEMLDISITNWCSRECETCYRMASRMGRHMAFLDYENVIRQAAQLGVTQVALGGGNPNEHPDFAEILRLTRRNYGIVPNYTTNGRGLSPKVLRVSAEHCGAVAVSAYKPYSFVADTVNKLRGYGIRTNLHFVLDAHSVKTALSWLYHPPEFMSQVNAIVFLNYKPIGRGAMDTRLLRRSNLYRDLIEAATSNVHSFKMGFDSCMVSGLVTTANVNPVWYDACEAARFSMFVSETLQMYPCSFMETFYAGVPLTDSNMLDTWQNAKPFQAIRSALRDPGCNGCDMQTLCRGGCPVLPSINLCDGAQSTYGNPAHPTSASPPS